MQSLKFCHTILLPLFTCQVNYVYPPDKYYSSGWKVFPTFHIFLPLYYLSTWLIGVQLYAGVGVPSHKCALWPSKMNRSFIVRAVQRCTGKTQCIPRGPHFSSVQLSDPCLRKCTSGWGWGEADRYSTCPQYPEEHWFGFTY